VTKKLERIIKHGKEKEKKKQGEEDGGKGGGRGREGREAGGRGVVEKLSFSQKKIYNL
jgi:hypothetical protein